MFLYHWSPGHQAGAFLGRELYLPKSWTDDRARCEEAGISKGVRFKTKGQLAKDMLKQAFKTNDRPAWVTGDTIYGSDRRLRVFLEGACQPFVLTIKSNESLWVMSPYGNGPRQVRAERISSWLAKEAFVHLGVGQGSKGERADDWALVPLARLLSKDEPFRHLLLVKRNLEGEFSYYVVFAPKEASLQELACVAGARWSTEVGFEEAKGLTGLDEYEVRKYLAWYRHVTLSLLAHAFLNVVKIKAREAEKGGSRR